MTKMKSAIARVAGVSLVAAALLSGPAVSSANAVTDNGQSAGSEDWAANEPASAPMGPSASQTLRIGASPSVASDCTANGRTYKTATNGGRANGSANTSCQAYYAVLDNYTDLRRDTGAGLQFLDDSSRATNTRSVTSISIYRCAGSGTRRYYSTGQYHVQAVGGASSDSVTRTNDFITC